MTTDAETSPLGPTTHPTLPDAERLGRFVVLRQLGQGGMGVVYVAYDELLDRRVALKLLRTDRHTPTGQARIRHEAKALARLSHPNVVQIYDVSASAGRIFIAMELVQGRTLRAWTAERRAAGADRRELLDMYIQAGRGLVAAHAAGLVHRDFKPDNVLVGDDGRARVVDFGLVGGPLGDAVDELSTTPHAGLTATGAMLGTPPYMSPEQLCGLPADARSDQFSFCAALHEALTGERPFAGDDVEALRATVTAGALRAPAAPLPEWLRAPLHRGLSPRPQDRFADLSELLGRLAADPSAVRRRRLRLALVSVASAVAAVAVALAVLELRAAWQARAREQAAALALQAAESRIADAHAAGDGEDAARTFAAFVADPLHDGTDALARAWLTEAARRERDGDGAGARTGLVTAYVQSRSAAQQAEALLALADHLRARLDWHGLTSLLALVDRDHPDVAGAVASLRPVAALGRRDLAGARDVPFADALARASPTSFRHISSVEVDDDRVALIEERIDDKIVHLAHLDAALTPIAALTFPTPTPTAFYVPGRPARVVGYADRTISVYDVAPDGLALVDAWTDDIPFVGVHADLDGDGAPELYLGTGTGLEILALRRDADGRLRRSVVYSATDSLQSYTYSLARLDLDGDGADELAAVFSGWRAFDIRVLRRDPAGERLVTASREPLAGAHGLALQRAADGAPRLVVNNFAHPDVDMGSFTSGPPRGIYMYGLAGDQLSGHRRIELPDTSGVSLGTKFGNPRIGDLDGDGREDIVNDIYDPRSAHTLVHLQRADDEFEAHIVGHLTPHAVAQLDDDPGHELIASVEDAAGVPRVWVVGAGADALPPLATAARAPLVPLVDPRDPSWTRQASHVATLKNLGLDADAADAFVDLGRRAADPELRARSLHTAAVEYERLGRDRDALTLFRAATRAPALAADALQGALRSQIRLGDQAAAAATLRELEGRPDLSPAARESLGEYRPLTTTDRVELDFSAPLDPAWTLDDPLALRREPGALALATAGQGVVASLPLELSPAFLDLSVTLDLDESEWSSRLEISLAPEHDLGRPLTRMVLSTVGTSRGWVRVYRQFFCVLGNQKFSYSDEPPLTARTTERSAQLELRLSAFPQLGGSSQCKVTDRGSGRESTKHLPALPDLPPSGRYRLVLRADHDVPAWLSARIHRIVLHGARVAAASPEHPARRSFRRALHDDDLATAVAAFASLPAPTAAERAWYAHALARTGRLAEARALWTPMLAAQDPHLRARVRAHPGLYGPLLRDVSPARYLDLTHAVWRNTAANHLDDPRARRAMLEAFTALDLGAASDDPAGLARDCDLHTWRGHAFLRADQPTLARRDLARALELAERLPAATPQHQTRWLLWLDLAELAVDAAAAEHALARARATTDMPLLLDDLLRARPALTRPR